MSQTHDIKISQIGIRSCLTTKVYLTSIRVSHTNAMHKRKHDAWWSSTQKYIKITKPSLALALQLPLSYSQTLSPFSIKRQKPKKTEVEAEHCSPSAWPENALHRLIHRPSSRRRQSDPLKLHVLAKRSRLALLALKLSRAKLAAQVLLTKLAQTRSLQLTSLAQWRKVEAAQTKLLTTTGARWW